VYSRAMGTNLARLVKRNYKELTADPNHIVAKAVEVAMTLENPTLNQFDQTFTCKAGGSMPPFPFETANDYYHWASSHNVINDIRIPYLAINADDDPIVQDVPLNAVENGYVVLELTAGGGHLGWFKLGHWFSIERWTTRPVLEWFKLMGDDVVHGPNQASSIFQDDDGFFRERSRPGLGCKELVDGGLIDWTTGEVGILQGL
jgi:predicted alpha/beta-fold hydrolase